MRSALKTALGFVRRHWAVTLAVALALSLVVSVAVVVKRPDHQHAAVATPSVPAPSLPSSPARTAPAGSSPTSRASTAIAAHPDCLQWTVSQGETTNFAHVQALRDDDVWASDGVIPGENGPTPLDVWRWDGKGWTQVGSFDEYGYGYIISAFRAFSDDDVWVVLYNWKSGSYAGGNLLEHFDGRAWNQVYPPQASSPASVSPTATPTSTPTPTPTPSTKPALEFQDIGGATGNQVWATGYDSDTGGFIARWDGATWQEVVHTPTVLTAFAAPAADDVWIGGTFHWDGSAWHHVTPPPDDPRAIAAHASNDVWAVSEAQLDHWNGASWSRIAAPAFPGTTTKIQMYGVTIGPDGRPWISGAVQLSGYERPGVIAEYAAKGWRVFRVPKGLVHGESFELHTLADLQFSSTSRLWIVGDKVDTRPEFAQGALAFEATIQC